MKFINILIKSIMSLGLVVVFKIVALSLSALLLYIMFGIFDVQHGTESSALFMYGTFFLFFICYTVGPLYLFDIFYVGISNQTLIPTIIKHRIYLLLLIFLEIIMWPLFAKSELIHV